MVGTAVGPRFGAVVATRHCHNEEEDADAAASAAIGEIAVRLFRQQRRPAAAEGGARAGGGEPEGQARAMFRSVLPPGTPILNWGCKDRAGEPVA